MPERSSVDGCYHMSCTTKSVIKDPSHCIPPLPAPLSPLTWGLLRPMRASSRSTTARTCLCSNRIKLASTDHCRAKTLLPHKKSISSSQSALDQIHILIICQSLTLPISIRAAWALLAAPASPVDGTPSRDILLASFVKVPDIPSGRTREGATGSCRPCEQNQTGETWGYEQVDSAAGSCRHCGVCRHRECGSPESVVVQS